MTGIDLSDKMIEKAREYDPHGNFLTMDMTDLNFPNASFDWIWCSAALLHLSKKDAMTTLGKMFRVLKKEGVLYLLLKEGAWETLTTDSRYWDAQKYYAYYQKEEIVKMLSENGFDVHRIEEHGQEDAYRKQTKILFIIGIKQ